MTPSELVGAVAALTASSVLGITAIGLFALRGATTNQRIEILHALAVLAAAVRTSWWRAPQHIRHHQGSSTGATGEHHKT